MIHYLWSGVKDVFLISMLVAVVIGGILGAVWLIESTPLIVFTPVMLLVLVVLAAIFRYMEEKGVSK